MWPAWVSKCDLLEKNIFFRINFWTFKSTLVWLRGIDYVKKLSSRSTVFELAGVIMSIQMSTSPTLLC